MAAKKSHTERKEQEYYYRVLQAAHFRSLALQSAYNKQSTVMFDMLQSLKRRKAATEVLDIEIQKLKQQHANAKPVRKYQGQEQGGAKVADKEDADADANGSSAAVVVKLKHSGAEVTIHRGQWVATPMGRGSWSGSFPETRK